MGSDLMFNPPHSETGELAAARAKIASMESELSDALGGQFSKLAWQQLLGRVREIVESQRTRQLPPAAGEYATAKLSESLADLLGGAALIIAVCPGQAGLELHLSARFGEGLPIEAQRLLWDFVDRTAASARQHATEILATGGQVVVRDVKRSPDGEVSDTPAPKAKA